MVFSCLTDCFSSLQVLKALKLLEIDKKGWVSLLWSPEDCFVVDSCVHFASACVLHVWLFLRCFLKGTAVLLHDFSWNHNVTWIFSEHVFIYCSTQVTYSSDESHHVWCDHQNVLVLDHFGTLRFCIPWASFKSTFSVHYHDFTSQPFLLPSDAMILGWLLVAHYFKPSMTTPIPI